MLNWDDYSEVYIFTGAIDMRIGFDRLANLIRSELNLSPLSGGVFVFFCRRRRRVKILYWERDGYWLLCKRLEAGTFRVCVRDGHERLSVVDLKNLLNGMELSRIKLQKDVENGVYQ